MTPYEMESKLRGLLPRDWPRTKLQIAKEFCLAHAEDSPDWIVGLSAMTNQDELLASKPIELFEEILLPISGNSDAVWSHRPAMGVDGGLSISLDDLSSCAGRYLAEGGKCSPALELWLSRKMIFEEMHALREEASPYLERRTFLRKLAALGPLLSGLVIILVSIWMASAYNLAIGVAAYLMLQACLLIKQHHSAKQLKPLLEVLPLMRRAHSCVMQPHTSPFEVEIALKNAEVAGAAWPHHLRDLVEQAKQRKFFHWA